MKIYSWNVNGIRAVVRKDVFSPFVNAEQPDILCIQETKAQPGECALGLPDYQDYWHSAEKKGYSGTAILSRSAPMDVRHGIAPEVCARYDMSCDGFGDPNTEGRV